MALIKDMKETSMHRNRVHDATETEYCIFTDDKGNKYLQIDTFGSPERKVKGVKSQTIQIGETAAKQLQAIFKKHFS